MIFSDSGNPLYCGVYTENSVIPISEFTFSDAVNAINRAVNKFLKMVKDAINYVIDFIDNNLLTKNKFYSENKNKIIEGLSNKTFNGYIFNIYQHNGGIDNLKTACSPKITNQISQYAENESEDFGDYLRGIMCGKQSAYDQGSFLEQAKIFIYGSAHKENHNTSEIYEGIDGMINRMLDKRKNIRALKDLYHSFEKFNINIINARKIDTGSDEINDFNTRCIEYANIHMNICYQYLQILINAIKDEYSQSQDLCMRAIS